MSRPYSNPSSNTDQVCFIDTATLYIDDPSFWKNLVSSYVDSHEGNQFPSVEEESLKQDDDICIECSPLFELVFEINLKTICYNHLFSLIIRYLKSVPKQSQGQYIFRKDGCLVSDGAVVWGPQQNGVVTCEQGKLIVHSAVVKRRRACQVVPGLMGFSDNSSGKQMGYTATLFFEQKHEPHPYPDNGQAYIWIFTNRPLIRAVRKKKQNPFK